MMIRMEHKSCDGIGSNVVAAANKQTIAEKDILDERVEQDRLVEEVRSQVKDPGILRSCEMQESDKKQGKNDLKCSVSINRGLIQAIPRSLHPHQLERQLRLPTFEEFHLESKGDHTLLTFCI
ncbi:hypothetical protein Tco_0666323 [Tanacetum coccineum]